MIPISNKLRIAIEKAADDAGNPYQLSLRVGVSNATVGKWLSGTTSKIYEETLTRLLPLLLPHLDREELKNYHSIFKYTVNECRLDLARVDETCVNVDALHERLQLSEKLLEKIEFVLGAQEKTGDSPFLEKNNIRSLREAIPLRESGVLPRPVPVISIAQAAGYEPALEPLCDYLRETSDRTAVFYDVPENCFALEVSGDSMSPDYPNGSIALVAAGEFPQRGDIVAAKLSDGQVVIKEYHRKDNRIALSSLNKDGQNFEWHCKENPGYVQWMWPVIEITLKPRDRRWAKLKDNGNLDR